MTKQEIEKLINANNIKIYDKDDTKITFYINPYDKAPEQTKNTIQSNKADILAYLYEQRDFEKRKKAREKAFEELCGYKIICDVAKNWDYYKQDVDDSYDDDTIYPRKPEITMSEICKKYPVGALYYEMKCWAEYAPNFSHSAAGERAVERMINGENPQTVYDEAQKEWAQAAEEAVLNS